MDKIKTVKIKNPDGSISEETYTISVDARNVDMKSGDNVQETIGDININRDGNIATQLDNLKNNRLYRSDIVDNLTSTDNTKVLSAKQGKVLKDNIDNITTIYATKEELETENSARVLSDTTLQNNLNAETNNRINADSALQSQINSLADGTPLVANSVSEMTDTTKIYINTSDGYWYYYNGSVWTSGGIYQATGVSVEDPVIEDLQYQLNTIYKTEFGVNYLNNEDYSEGGITAQGTITTVDAWANYRTTQYIEVKAGDIYKGYTVPTTNNRLVCCFFDKNKNPIDFYNEYGITLHTITVQQDGYIRCSTEKSNFGTSFMLTKGSEVLSTYVPFYDYKYILIPREPGTITGEELNNDFINETPKYYSTIDIDFTQSVDGYLEINGTIRAHDSYKTTDYIKVQDFTKYVISPRVRKFTFYDNNKILLDFEDVNVNQPFEYVPPRKGYIRFSYYKAQESNIEMVKKRNPEINKKLEDGALLSNSMKQEVLEMIENQYNMLAGKKWWACGDSFTEWSTEEFNPNDYPNITDELADHHYKTYPFWIGSRNGMIVHNYSKSGQTLAMPASGGITNAFSNNLYTQIPNDVDYITIQLGINDSHNSSGDNIIPLGTIDDTTAATFYGAWNVVLPYLIEHHPFAHIGVLVTNGCETSDYRTATIECCRKWGIPFIDLNGDDRTPFMMRSTNESIDESVRLMRTMEQSADYPSNQHPNAAAHLYSSYFIENFLKSI